MGYYPIRVERSDGTLKTVHVQKTNDLDREASHDTFTDPRGNRYRPSGRFGVFVEIEADETPDAPAPALVVAPPSPPEQPERVFTVAVHGGAGLLPDSARVYALTNAQGDQVFVAADDSGRIFRHRPHGVSGVQEIGG